MGLIPTSSSGFMKSWMRACAMKAVSQYAGEWAILANLLIRCRHDERVSLKNINMLSFRKGFLFSFYTILIQVFCPLYNIQYVPIITFKVGMDEQGPHSKGTSSHSYHIDDLIHRVWFLHRVEPPNTFLPTFTVTAFCAVALYWGKSKSAS